jgi:hypothetical protein
MTVSSFFSRRRTRRISTAFLAIGAICFGLGAISFVLSRNLFDPVSFGRRAAESLSDPGVAAFAADLVTSGIVRGKPDLIAFRPMLSSAAEVAVSSKAFSSVVEQAASQAHQAAFSEGAERVLLSLPDLNILVHDALSHASPALAAKVPKTLDSSVAKLANSKAAAVFLRLARAGRRVNWTWPVLFAVALGLYTLALWLAPDRQRAMVRAGIGLIVVGLLVAGIVAVNPLAGVWLHDEKQLGLVRGLWRTYLGELTRWGLLFAGLGVLLASGASSLLERMDPLARIAHHTRTLATPPRTRAGRLLWGSALLIAGCLTFSYPALVLNAAAAVIGICAAYIGSRELFRLFLETLEKEAPDVDPELGRHGRLATLLIALLVPILGVVWFVWRNPAEVPVRASAVLACNGFPELCDRRLDQVAFPGAHNAMSHQDAPGWMFPHHEAGMPRMLQDGIRALLIDVHYGFPGGSRIKTDLSAEPNAAMMKQAMGSEGYNAAMRIRDRLVGVDESKHAAYFCHGFCELGAYPVAPALRELRDFAVAHPDEVILLVVEDYITPQDLAAEFDHAGFAGLIYTGNPSPQWPTLRQLIESGQRVVVFTESGRPGVPWLRPAFQTFQETPYSFHKLQDFTCRANRGGNTGPLFQINHWIDTTPTPKPSNAALVNAYPFLLSRAEQCAAERRRLPNLVAVDFYRTGDLLAVVNKLNGVAGQDSPAPESLGARAAEPTP